MTTPLIIVVISIFILSALVIGIIIRFRHRITSMTGMMIAMALGMSTGLTIGVIVGIIFAGNLFYSTVIAMLTGVIFGLFAGMPLSLVAVLDGTLSGMMGGMMGAMLGEMIKYDYQDAFIRIMFMFFIATVIILFWMMQQEFIKGKRLWNHPLVSLIIFVIIMIGFQQLGPFVSSSKSSEHHHMESGDMQMKSFIVQADEFSFSPNKMEVTAGQTVKIVLDHIGKVNHHLQIIGVEEQGKNSRLQMESAPRQKSEAVYTLTTPGEYKYVCTISGHQEAGMEGELEVTNGF
ncbi:plastocyanin/azurin family copper-binding protein [Virgibacillus proomii]|uniref:plastocyanin/azurin family copper-binding protein n=1 Tax=Virgibacillus proomii TaxID=84407 RepID=UPI0015C334C9|nr:plastocyanin/azurin family copper-binding protein [Virgibacillus proomii]